MTIEHVFLCRRDDKTWETATTLSELKNLYKVSKEANDFDIDYASKDKDDEGKNHDRLNLFKVIP